MSDGELAYEHTLEAIRWLRKGERWARKKDKVKINEPMLRYTTYLRYARYCYRYMQYHLHYAMNTIEIVDDIIDVISPDIGRLAHSLYLTERETNIDYLYYRKPYSE